jgi:hypothetical protein
MLVVKPGNLSKCRMPTYQIAMHHSVVVEKNISDPIFCSTGACGGILGYIEVPHDEASRFATLLIGPTAIFSGYGEKDSNAFCAFLTK